MQVGEDGKIETSGEKPMTRTLDFMAIEILGGAVRLGAFRANSELHVHVRVWLELF